MIDSNCQDHKTHLVLLDGVQQSARGRIEVPVGREPHHSQCMAVVPGDHGSLTGYHMLERFACLTGPAAGDHTLVRADLKAPVSPDLTPVPELLGGV